MDAQDVANRESVDELGDQKVRAVGEFARIDKSCNIRMIQVRERSPFFGIDTVHDLVVFVRQYMHQNLLVFDYPVIGQISETSLVFVKQFGDVITALYGPPHKAFGIVSSELI